MCGIAGIYLKKKDAATTAGVESFANELLLGIERRGRQATGFVAVGWDGEIKLDKAAKSATEFVKEREPFPKDVQTVLLHTRFATQGKVEEMGNNHPVSYQTCFATHNGHISNDDEVFEDEGLIRRYEVDSEAIPAVLWKHTLGNSDDIKQALEKLRGDMAIAAIDPVKYPSKLLLAKGAGSPLYILETKKVIIWASTHEAIREAWGKLLGTPPELGKIKQVNWGKFYVAEGYKSLQEHSFSPKSSYRDNSGWEGVRYNPLQMASAASRNRNGVRVLEKPTGGGRTICKPWDSTGAFNSKGEFESALRLYLIDATLPLKKARTWEQRRNDELTEKDLEDVKGNISWYNCPTCERSVLREDYVPHLKYGSICLDCHSVCFRKWASNNAGAEVRAEGSTARIPQLIPNDRANLEKWALVESKTHRYTLEALSDDTGYSAHTLDFLLFRTGATAADFGNNMVHLKYALKKRYDELSDETHAVLGEEILREVVQDTHLTVEKAQEWAGEQLYPWTAFSEEVLGRSTKQIRYECDDHGERFDFGETCFSCLSDDQEGALSATECGVRVFEGDDNEVRLDKCESCFQWIIPGQPCAVCDKAHEELLGRVLEARTERQLEPGEAQEEAQEKAQKKAQEVLPILPPMPDLPRKCSCKTVRNRVCKMGVRTAKEVNGKLVGFCTNHWNVCATGGCIEKANFTSTDGKRYCHKDSRRKPGESDTSAGNASRIMEVKK